MNIIRATHQLAMDMSILAEFSKAKGFYEDAKDFFIKAFELERKAALMTTSKDKDPLPHFILLRSAAALAYKSGQYKESERLIEICFSENPPAFIKTDLKEIISLIKKDQLIAPKSSTLDFQISGLLTKINAEENEITIKDAHQEQNYAIIVSKKQLMEIVKKYWFQKVLIQVRQTTYGVMVLENICKAA